MPLSPLSSLLIRQGTIRRSFAVKESVRDTQLADAAFARVFARSMEEVPICIFIAR